VVNCKFINGGSIPPLAFVNMYRYNKNKFFLTDPIIQKLNIVLNMEVNENLANPLTILDLVPRCSFFKKIVFRQYPSDLHKVIPKQAYLDFKLIEDALLTPNPEILSLDYYLRDRIDSFYRGFESFIKANRRFKTDNKWRFKSPHQTYGFKIPTFGDDIAFLHQYPDLKNPSRFWAALERYIHLIEIILRERLLYLKPDSFEKDPLNQLNFEQKILLFKIRELEFREIYVEIKKSFIDNY
jgi:hypothetical protein